MQTMEPIGKEEEEPLLYFSDGEWICARELGLRRRLSFAFRLSLATFLAWQWWDLLFSPIWMHGYLWALNQPNIVEQTSMGADKSAVAILDLQLAKCGQWERAMHALLSTLGVWLLLHCAGFSRQQQKVWALVKLAVYSGGVSGLARAVQMQQRLLPCIHECFYAFVLVFMVGLCLTLRTPSSAQQFENQKKTE